MHPKLTTQIARQAIKFGVTPEQVLSRSRVPGVVAARYAVWGKLLTHYAGGDFPANTLAKVFNCHPSTVRVGAALSGKSGTHWPKPTIADAISDEVDVDVAVLQRKLSRLRVAYRMHCGPGHPSVVRQHLKKQCEAVAARIQERKAR